MSEPLVLKVDASELEEASRKLDEFADKAQRTEDSAGGLADAFKKTGDATAAAADGYDKLTVMQRAYLEKNTAVIAAYDAEYNLALRKLQAQTQEAEGYTQLTEAQKGQIENSNVLQAQATAEERVLAAVARAQDNLAKSTEKTTQTVNAQSKTVQDVTAYWEKQRQAHNNWVNSSKAVDAQLTKQKEEFVELSVATQRVLDRYDPLGTKLRSLQSDFARLNAEVSKGAGAGNEQAIEKAYAGLNSEMSKVKSMMDIAAGAVVDGNGKITTSSGNAAHGVAGITRELLVLGHEALNGNYSRIPGSLIVMANRLASVVDIFSILLNPVTYVGVALAGMFAIMLKGESDLEHFNTVLQATNNYAGMTATQFNQMAERVSKSTTLTIGTVKEIGNEMIQTGKFTADNIEQMMRLVDNFANITGQSTDEAAKYLIKLFEDPAKAALELNDKFKQLDATELNHIQTLVDQGHAQEAVTEALDQFNSKLPDHVNNLMTLDGVWNAIRKSISGAISALKDFSSPEGQLKAMKGLLSFADSANSTVFGKAGQMGLLSVFPTSGLKENIALLEKQIDADNRDAAAKHEQSEEIKRQQEGLIAINKYAAEATQRAQLLKAKQEIGLVVTDDPELLAKQLESIQKIDEALANLGKKKPTEFDRVMAQITKMGVDAQLAYDNFGKAVDEKTVPALKLLSELQHSDVWKQFTDAQKAQITNELNRIGAVQKSTAAMEAQQRVQAELVKLQAQYSQVTAQAAKIDAQTRTAAINNSAKEALATAKRMYDEGLIDVRTFYETQTYIQKQQLDDQVDNFQAAVDAQEKIVKDLQDQLSNLTLSKFGGDMEKWTKEGVTLSGQLEVALANLRKAYQQLGQAQQQAAGAGKEYFSELVAQNKDVLDLNSTLEQQIKTQQTANETYGMSAASVQEYKAARDELLLQDAMLKPNNEENIEALKKQIALRRELAATLRQGEDQKALVDTIKSLDQEAQKVWQDLFSGGHDTFKKLGDDIKKYLIDMLYQLVVRPFVINIAANLLGVPQANLGSLGGAVGGGAGGVGNLFGGLNAAGLNPFAGGNGGISSLLGSGPGFLGLQSVSSSMATLNIAFEAGADAVGGFTNVLGAAAGVAAPLIPLLAAAVPLLSGLFSHEPSQVHARFQITPTGTGAGTNEGGAGGTVASPYGDLGFNNADTMYFSGSAGTALSNIVLGALQAFQPRLSTEQNQRLTQTLQSTNFGTFEGSYTTEDFIKQYGGDILKKVVVAAFHELDPALESVAANFTGTADDIAKFANSLLAIHDATQAIGNEDFTKNVDAALQGADQAMADKVLAFVTIVQSLGTPLDGLREKMLALDPANITKFVDALGGAQQALQGIAFVNSNFTTGAQQLVAAQDALAKSWDAAGITADDLAHANLTTFPQTHEQFLALLNSIDVNSEHGRDLAATLINTVAPAFVAVQGTADAAAQALLQQAQAGRDYYTQHFLSPAEQLTQRQSVDETKLFEATQAGTLLNKVLSDFGLNVIPSTVKGVHDLVEATVAKYGADSEEAKQLYAIIPIIGDLIDSVGGFGDAAQQAADQIANATGQIVVSVGSVIEDAVGAANTILGNFDNLVGSGTGDFGSKLAQKISLINDAIKAADKSAFPNGTAYEAYINTLKGANANFTTELAEFNRLTQTYSADVAEQLIGLEEWRNQQYDIFKNMPEDLKVVDQIFQQRWDAIVNGTKTGVTAVQQTIEDFIKSLGTLVDQSHGTLGQRLQIEADAGFSKVQDLVAQLAALPPGSPLAAGIQSDIAKISVFNGKLVNYIADFTTLTAQYGADIANQLVALEMWRDEQKDALRAQITDATQLAAALGVVDQIFNDEWKSVVDGISGGVDGALDELKRLKQGILDYVNGLKVGELSPLTPLQQFNQAQDTFNSDYAKAAGGDKDALGRITDSANTYLQEARNFYASSQAYTDIFNRVVSLLTALGSSPTTSATGTSTTNVQPLGVENGAGTTTTNTATSGTVSAGSNVEPIAAPTAIDISSLTGALPNDGTRLASGGDIRSLVSSVNALGAPQPVLVERTTEIQDELSRALPPDGNTLASSADINALVGRVDTLDGIMTAAFQRFLDALLRLAPAGESSTNVEPITQPLPTIGEAPAAPQQPALVTVDSTTLIARALPADGARISSGSDIRQLADRLESLETELATGAHQDMKQLQGLVSTLISRVSSSSSMLKR